MLPVLLNTENDHPVPSCGADVVVMPEVMVGTEPPEVVTSWRPPLMAVPTGQVIVKLG